MSSRRETPLPSGLQPRGRTKAGKIKKVRPDDAREASAKRGFPKNQPKGMLREGTSFLLNAHAIQKPCLHTHAVCPSAVLPFMASCGKKYTKVGEGRGAVTWPLVHTGGGKPPRKGHDVYIGHMRSVFQDGGGDSSPSARLNSPECPLVAGCSSILPLPVTLTHPRPLHLKDPPVMELTDSGNVAGMG